MSFLFCFITMVMFFHSSAISYKNLVEKVTFLRQLKALSLSTYPCCSLLFRKLSALSDALCELDKTFEYSSSSSDEEYWGLHNYRTSGRVETILYTQIECNCQSKARHYQYIFITEPHYHSHQNKIHSNFRF